MKYLEWTNLAMEPILGSGEFVNVGIVARIESEFTYIPILDERKCHYLFGSKGQALYQNIEYLVAALRRSPVEDLDTLCLPLTGSRLAAFRGALVDNVPEFLQTLKQYSFLGHPGFEQSLAENSREITRERFLAKFVQEVKNDLMVVSKNYSKLFSVEYELPNVSFPIKYGFSTSTYVANFSYIHPGQYLTGLMKNTTYKLLDLGLLHQATIADKPTQFELILHAPTIAFPKSPDEERYLKETEKLHLFAQDNGIQIFGTQEVKGAVSHLISKIVA